MAHAVEHFAGIETKLAIQGPEVRAIARESARIDELAEIGDGRDRVAGRQGRNLSTQDIENRVAEGDPTNLVFGKRSEYRFDLPPSTSLIDLDWAGEGMSDRPRLFGQAADIRIARIDGEQALGTSSFSSSNRFAVSPTPSELMPVTFPPG